jgi:hypothetical protein
MLEPGISTEMMISSARAAYTSNQEWKHVASVSSAGHAELVDAKKGWLFRRARSASPRQNCTTRAVLPPPNPRIAVRSRPGLFVVRHALQNLRQDLQGAEGSNAGSAVNSRRQFSGTATRLPGAICA